MREPNHKEPDVTYPGWICGDCGERYGKRIPKHATWHIDECGWCHDPVATVTEPRDFGYPDAPVPPPLNEETR